MQPADTSASQRSTKTVRSLRPEDVDAVLAVAAESPEASSWSKTSYQTLFEQDGALLLAIEQGGAIVGFLVGRQAADQAEILNLAVKKDLRYRGFATELLAEALRHFQANRAQSVYLEVRQSNAAAIAFYSRHGFGNTGSRRAYYRNPPEDAVTMMRKFTG